MPKTDRLLKVLLAVIAVLLVANLARDFCPPVEAAADHGEGPVGTYQLSSYVLPPTNTRPNYQLGYYLLDTRTGKVEREDENIW